MVFAAEKNSPALEDLVKNGREGEWAQSKASFHGYGIWVMPADNSPCQIECLETMDKFRTRFPPILHPKWKPHVSIAAGISDKEAAIKAAQKLSLQFSNFEIDLSGGSGVDREANQVAIYFPGQRLRAGWIHPSVNGENKFENEFGEDLLGHICRTCRQHLGGETTTGSTFAPHLSIFYFDKDELDEEQRTIIKNELNVSFKGKEAMSVQSVFVVRTEGKPGDWGVVKEFRFQQDMDKAN